jgi:AcrR family transcriptional regulator
MAFCLNQSSCLTMTYVSPIESFALAVLARAPNKSDQHERKERVIAATLVACSKTGPLDLKIGEIADAAGVSTASIYKDFLNGGEVLTQSVLRAYDVLLLDWSLNAAPQNQSNDPLASVSAFLIKYGETYRHPYSNWLIRSDLTMSATESNAVRFALIGFHEHVLRYGLLSLPRNALGFPDLRDLLHILIGAVQVHIIRALFDAPLNSGGEPSAEHLDLPRVIANILGWITQAPAQTSLVGTNSIGSLDKAFRLIQQSKSAIETYAETLLSRRGGRFDANIRRDRIMAATMQHCAVNGMEAASVSQIAKLAGVSTASVYREFEDKTALIKASVGRFLPLYAKATMGGTDVEDPIERIKSLLAAQVITLTDPFGAWLYRYYVKLEVQRNDEMKAVGLAARKQSDLFWEDQLKRLEDEGYLVPTDTDLTRTMLFGAVHRRSVQARILHQDDAIVWAEVQASIGAATHMLFRLYGSASKAGLPSTSGQTAQFEPTR